MSAQQYASGLRAADQGPYASGMPVTQMSTQQAERLTAFHHGIPA